MAESREPDARMRLFRALRQAQHRRTGYAQVSFRAACRDSLRALIRLCKCHRAPKGPSRVARAARRWTEFPSGMESPVGATSSARLHIVIRCRPFGALAISAQRSRA